MLSGQLVVTGGNQAGESALGWVRCREVSSWFPPIAVFSAPVLAHGLSLEAVGSCWWGQGEKAPRRYFYDFFPSLHLSQNAKNPEACRVVFSSGWQCWGKGTPQLCFHICWEEDAKLPVPLSPRSQWILAGGTARARGGWKSTQENLCCQAWKRFCSQKFLFPFLTQFLFLKLTIQSVAVPVPWCSHSPSCYVSQEEQHCKSLSKLLFIHSSSFIPNLEGWTRKKNPQESNYKFPIIVKVWRCSRAAICDYPSNFEVPWEHVL